MGMDISIYVSPSSVKPPVKSGTDEPLYDTLGRYVHTLAEVSEEDLVKFGVAIVGVTEDRFSAGNKGSAQSPDLIRKHLFRLSKGSEHVKVLDVGNILPGETVADTYYALSQVIGELNKKRIVPLVLGGSQDLTFAMYRAYEKQEQTINIATADRRFDLGDASADMNSENYLTRIILHQPNYLFNYTNLATQGHYVDVKTLDFIDKLYFDQLRLGDLRSNPQKVEPLVRNADIFSFDMGCIRFNHAPANAFVSPNGLTGEEACRIMRYAGMSDKLSSAGIFEVNPLFDNREQTVALAAQMAWYFIEGFFARKKDLPHLEKSTYLNFRVALEANKTEIVFYKSPKSDRWWMEVPYPSDKRLKFERHHLVPCDYSDYEAACRHEIPDLWWKTWHKLS